jgi:hydroxymethylpyrimidine pyrophosphatase-like HAD family hydrolase
VSARVIELVLFCTFDQSKGQEVFEEASVPIDILDRKFAYHLTRKGITKAQSLEKGLDFLRIPPDETVAIGDSETVFSMFEICGSRAAAANTTEVKSKADYVCKGVIGDRVVEAIDYFLSNRAA